MAKRKADDLEDFTDTRSSLSSSSHPPSVSTVPPEASSLTLSHDTATEANLSTTISPELTAAGTKLTEKILLTWANSATTTLDSTTVDAGDDVEMAGAEVGGEEGVKVSKELLREYELLKSCFGGFEKELEESVWAKVVLSQTY